MKTETITIPRIEYEKLKKRAEVDWQLVEKIKRSLEDVKQGRVTEVKPKIS